MQLFREYIQPLTYWLHAHPEWAIVFTFFISFSESLAIIGSIIPGSVTMTGIGILAGSGVIPIPLTLLAACLGAIAGDSASYLLGYFYSDKLQTMWPFSRYPQWIDYGKSYFEKHGGKSVLIGRFVGPLRSIIPVIAGMMRMSHWRFYIANITSALLWSLLYMLPGVLLGAASSELPPETATKLLLLVLIVLGLIWIITLLFKVTIVQVHRYLYARLHHFWLAALRKPYISKLLRMITPRHEKNHYPTAMLFLTTMVIGISWVVLTVYVYQQGIVQAINGPWYTAIQSLRSNTFDSTFIYLFQIKNTLPLTVLALSIGLFIIGSKNWRLLAYYTCMLVSIALILLFCRHFIPSPHPAGIFLIEEGFSYPAYHLTFLTALTVSILFYTYAHNAPGINISMGIAITVLLLLVGFGEMLLGDYWLTDILGAYGLGVLIVLTFWILYRRKPLPTHQHTAIFLLFCLISLSISVIFTCQSNYETTYVNHQPFFQQYKISKNTWWKQKKPVLPLYQTGRFGHPMHVFNLQYAGSLEHLRTVLMRNGWTKNQETFYKALLKYPIGKNLTLIPQLYLNRKPSLILHHTDTAHHGQLIIRIWRSNYYLEDTGQNIWIGTIYQQPPTKPKKVINQPTQNAYKINHNPTVLIDELLKPPFLLRTVQLPIPYATQKQLAIQPTLLLIQEQQ